jgi:glutamine amidotransferase
MIGIIDYNAGNIRSVEHALSHLGFEYRCSKNPGDLAQADRVIFPGVGDARYAMGQLEKTGYASFLKDCAARGVPVLGICLGSQIIFDFSEEGDADCLGLVKGKIRHLSAVYQERNIPRSFKIPHMGWNDLRGAGEGGRIRSVLFDGVDRAASFYFVHSYVICPEDPQVVAAVADYGVPVPAVIQSGPIFALQFHPEKSGEPGLQILRNFAGLPAECLTGDNRRAARQH